MPGYGVLAQNWWVPVLWVIIFGHVTNVCNTCYLHRSATHGGVKFHPVVEHFMRFWCWLTAGIVTREWVAVHRKHHAFADREGDPHSPTVEGLAQIVFGGLFFYQRAAKDKAVLEKYGKGCPDDWAERNIYAAHRSIGVYTMLALDLYLFGLGIGLLVWSCMALWVPIMGNIINGIGHALGYRTFETQDHSRNIYPWGIWILGEELHNNHHADPRSAKFKAHWWEFDIGWFYIRSLQLFGLADVVYARSASAKEFAAQYYEEPAGPMSDRLERAMARIQKAKEEGLARIDSVREDGRARIESVRSGGMARLEQVKEECLARLEGATDEGRSRLDRIKTERLDKLESLKEDARSELDRAREAARARIHRVVESLALEMNPATD